MSFSFSRSGSAKEIKHDLELDQQVPEAIKTYVTEGVDALVKQFGEEQGMVASAFGHLHTGEAGNADQTTATITIKRLQ